MKTTLNALAIALALSARLVASQAHAADFGSSINDAQAAVSTSGFNSPYSQADNRMKLPKRVRPVSRDTELQHMQASKAAP